MPILDAEPSAYPPDLLAELVTTDSSRRWHVVYTKARQEKSLARDLGQLQIPFYLPLVPRDHLIRGRRVRSFIPLFGGYVFVFINESERIRCLSTNRAASILTVDDQDRLTHDLRQIARLIDLNAPLTMEKRISAGTTVRIKTGPMEGLEGVVLSRRGHTRLLVSVQMLQQGVSVEIDDFLLESAD